MKLVDARVTFLDAQTTGAKPTSGNLLELAWCIGSARHDQPEELRSYLIKQPDDQTIPARIKALTGISDDDMTSAVALESAREHLMNCLQSSDRSGTAIIHFAQFERPFLEHAFEEHYGAMHIYCTHQIAARLFPNLPSRGIRGLAGYFGLCIEECKRAASHVMATYTIWRNLCEKLGEHGIETFEQLDTWLNETKAAKRTKYEYPLDKNIRLSMPDRPGVYRMLSRTGEVLYVGKATSLKSRVNSYFRGQKGRDSRKLEMLTQTWDIYPTVCDTVVHACVLEVEDIKRLSPPYNISLKTGIRPLVFYSADFSGVSVEQSDVHPIGPFRSEFIMDSFCRLNESLRTGEMDPLMFFDELTPELLIDGFEEFLNKNNLTGDNCSNPRSLLAIGIKLCRLYAALIDEEEDSTADSEEPSQSDVGEAPAPPAQTAQSYTAEPAEEIELTPEEVAGKYERLLMRAGRSYLLAKRLTRLLNSDITFKENGGVHLLRTRNGVLLSSSDTDSGKPTVLPNRRWHGLSIETFDRLRVLNTELARVAGEDDLISVHYL